MLETPGPGCLGEQPISRTQTTAEERIDAESITGPHIAQDAKGDTYAYWQCEACGVETTDGSIRTGCFRCGGDAQ